MANIWERVEIVPRKIWIQVLVVLLQLYPIFLKAPDSTEEEEMKPLKKQDKKMSTSQEDFLNSLQVGKSQNKFFLSSTLPIKQTKKI